MSQYAYPPAGYKPYVHEHDWGKWRRITTWRNVKAPAQRRHYDDGNTYFDGWERTCQVCSSTQWKDA